MQYGNITYIKVKVISSRKISHYWLWSTWQVFSYSTNKKSLRLPPRIINCGLPIYCMHWSVSGQRGRGHWIPGVMRLKIFAFRIFMIQKQVSSKM